MKRFLTLFLAPLLMMIMSSFSFSSPSEKSKVIEKDSTTVISVEFTPAQLVLKDNRTAIDVTTIIGNNTLSNLAVADAISKVAEVLTKDAQERRYVSVKDRMIRETGLSPGQIEKIIHKKKVYDMISYVLFIISLLFVWYGITQHTWFFKSMTINEVSIRTISYAVLIVVLILLFKYGDFIVNQRYHEIASLIKTAPA